MPSLCENKERWSTYDWSQRGDEWSTYWGGSASLWYGALLPRLRHYLPARHILEIACGYGRMTQFLLPLCERFTAFDITEKCISHCRERFSSSNHAEFQLGDGLHFSGVESGSVDFAFSWDSMVHCSPDVLVNYVAELARVLTVSGFAFIHHSNLGSLVGNANGESRPVETHWRDPGMTAQLFRDFCRESGLICVAQELLPWAGEKYLDCCSLLVRPDPKRDYPVCRIFQNDRFNEEVTLHGLLYQHYHAGNTTGLR